MISIVLETLWRGGYFDYMDTRCFWVGFFLLSGLWVGGFCDQDGTFCSLCLYRSATREVLLLDLSDLTETSCLELILHYFWRSLVVFRKGLVFS